MDKLPVTKMHSLGNDFLILDWVALGQELSSDLIRNMCDRRFGLGADQCLCLCPLEGHPVAHFGYRIFNADGHEVEQCGNGVRCLAYFIHKHYDANLDPVCLLSSTGRSWQAWQIKPMHYGANLGRVEMEESCSVVFPDQEKAWNCQRATIGNPHAIVWVDQSPDHYPLDLWGKWLQSHDAFPEGVNMGLVHKIDDHTVEVRVYERGVGETLACGSHACSVAAVGIRQGLLQSPVTVQMPGGFLQVADQDGQMCLLGSVTEVFHGEYCVPEHLIV